MTFLYFFFMTLFLICSLLLCLLVLVQEGKGGGLGTTFGSSDSSDSLFGTSTPEILKKVTGWLATGFMTACLILSFWTGSLARNTASQYTTPQTEVTE
ncbi:MAG: preprotein translocase subunit SecG [Verrucomicrobia bacterium]|nr:preprotein translocase subunit SecG [Verrucomicrobiota bacterium]MBS0637809.1 preprotein translocase subunit SecG [Verrucomicrobiota bacterium]